MLKTGVMWLVSTMLGVAVGASALVALRPKPPQPPCTSPSERDRERLNHHVFYHPHSILCFYSKAIQAGDPVGYFPVHPCDPDRPSLSQELDEVLTLGEDGYLRVADADRLRAAHEHAGKLSGWIRGGGKDLADVSVLCWVDVNSATTTCLNRISQRWHQPRTAAIQSIAALEEVIVEHWEELECCCPRQQPVRSLEENLTGIIERNVCDIPDYVRDAAVAAIASARLKGAQSSGKLRNDAVAAIADARTKLMTKVLDAQQDDLCQMLRQYDELERTTPDVPERIRKILIQFVNLEAKYPATYRAPLSKYQVWTALQVWPESTSADTQRQ